MRCSILLIVYYVLGVGVGMGGWVRGGRALQV